jgi:hypothetical protein
MFIPDPDFFPFRIGEPNFFHPGSASKRASGRGLGFGILEFFGPQIALANQVDAISQGPKNSRIPGPYPLPLALVMDMHASKHYARGCINHRCINSYFKISVFKDAMQAEVFYLFFSLKRKD